MLQLFWLLPLATLFQEMSALKKKEKRRKENNNNNNKRGNKKGQVPGTSKERKRVRIRGTRYPSERKEKEEHLILLIKFQKKQGRYVSAHKSKSRIRLSPLLSPSSLYTIHSPHMHILIWLIDLFLWIHGLTIQ